MKRLRKWLFRLVLGMVLLTALLVIPLRWIDPPTSAFIFRDGLRGASTITQQLAKNLYLWPNQSWVRKGLESWFTVWLELFVPKHRILHIYLNIVELDEGVFGAEAGARHYFDIGTAQLTPPQAALLAAALPAPKRLNPAVPNAFLKQRQKWILKQMRNLGPGWVP